MRFFSRLSEGPVMSSWASDAVAGEDAGCVLHFDGTIRNHSRGREVLFIDYEAFPEMVLSECSRIAAEIFAQFDVLRIGMEHAVGRVRPGETAVLLAVASVHRKAAYSASLAFMQELKGRAPLWKHEHYPDGTQWVGQGS